MQDKVNIAAVKEKVSNAATKGREAFKSLIHKAKHSPEDPKPTGTLNEPKPTEALSELKPTGTLSEPKSTEALSELKPTETLSEPKPTEALSELKPTGTLNEPKPTEALSEVKPTGTFSEPKSTEALNCMDDDSDEPAANSPKTSMERRKNLVSKLKRGLKVGKKNTDAENRAELLDRNPDDLTPRMRSADSIKVAYGHKPSTDPTSIAAMNREKLIERQEKIQAMNKESEELVEGAGDFASMAEELAKKIENKPWYKL